MVWQKLEQRNVYSSIYIIAVFTDINSKSKRVYLKTMSMYNYFFFKVKVINIHDRYQTKLLSVHGFTQNGQDGVSSK